MRSGGRSDIPAMRCPYDFDKLEYKGTQKVELKKNNLYQLSLPIYKCYTCGRFFTSHTAYGDMTVLNIDDTKVINLLKRNKSYNRVPKPQFSPHVVRWKEAGRPVAYKVRDDYHRREAILYAGDPPKQCKDGHTPNKTIPIDVIYKVDDKTVTSKLYVCSECGMLYVDVSLYNDLSSFLTFRNKNDLETLRKEDRKTINTRRNLAKSADTCWDEQPYYKKTAEYNTSGQSAQSHGSSFKVLRKPTGNRQTKSVLTHQKKDQHGEHFGQGTADTLKTSDLKNEKRQKVVIDATDFVVRRNVFNCRHNKHKLRDVDAEIQLIAPNGELITRTVSAGYCPNCDVFFLMESVFQSVKRFGILLCRVQNEKTYLKNGTTRGNVKLADESMLKQYGYNVSQKEGLSVLQRRKILSLLVDLGILTRSEIISHLDFLISWREGTVMFEQAISKWEEDREFIANYRKGDYIKIGVTGIRRKY